MEVKNLCQLVDERKEELFALLSNLIKINSEINSVKIIQTAQNKHLLVNYSDCFNYRLLSLGDVV